SSDQVLPAASFRRKSVIFCGAESICTPEASKATKGRTQRANRGMARTSDGIAVIRPLYPKSQGAVSAVGQDWNLDPRRYDTAPPDLAQTCAASSTARMILS